MIVRKVKLGKCDYDLVAKLNDNDCKAVKWYYESGLSFIEAFHKVVRKSRNNPRLITAYTVDNDKYLWLLKMYQIEQSVH